MPLIKAPGAEVIPGYRLLEPISQGGLAEIWKCSGPGGRPRVFKLIAGAGAGAARVAPGSETPLRYLERLAGVRHPYLLTLEQVRFIDDDLVLITEPGGRTLRHVHDEYRSGGRTGIPRAELLAFLREAAEILDLLNSEYRVAHLDVKPENLFLIEQHIKLADAGLVQALTELQGGAHHGVTLESITPRYAAPESFRGESTPFSDQYSLAILYQELLTGEAPFTGKTFRQLAVQHLQGEPDLRRLPETDRAAVARALAKEPGQRFPRCSDFVQALLSEGGPQPTAVESDNPSEAEVVLEASLVEVTAAPKETVLAPSTGAQVATGLSLQGYVFLECLARTAASEVWKAQTAGGARRLVKLFFGFDVTEKHEGGSIVNRLQALRHEGLVHIEVQLCGSHRLAVIAEPSEQTLAGRLAECQAEGLPGIPRVELLSHLRTAAETLDALRRTHRVQHLGLTPQHLLLDAGRLRIADYGLIELLLLPAGQAPTVHPRYAARELFAGQVSNACDQYSLALIYQELLTGSHPFRHLSPRQLVNRIQARPDLGMLPSIDRAAVQRALHPSPEKRFGSCAAFVAALEKAAPKQTPVLPLVRKKILVPEKEIQLATLTSKKVIGDLIGTVVPGVEVREYSGIRYVLQPGRALEHRCFARLLPGMARLKLDGFRQQWQAEVVSDNSRGMVYQVRMAAGFWQRCLGRASGLEVQVRFPSPHTDSQGLTEVAVAIRPLGSGSDRGAQMLHEIGPLLLESIRNYLQAYPERRGQERLPFEERVQVYSAFADQNAGPALLSQTRDISLRGMGLYLPCQPPLGRVCIELSQHEQTQLAAQIVRSRSCGDGRFEVGVRFLLQESNRAVEAVKL